MKAVIALLDDLFFTVKIADAAKRAGLAASFVKTPESLFDAIQREPSVVVLDLNYAGADPVNVAARVKSAFPGTPVIGFVSHVQTELRRQAQEAGCDAVVARSVFSTQLPQILSQHSA